MPTSRYALRSFDGFHFLDEGPRTQPPVLLLHGMLGDLSNWDDTIGALTAVDYRVVAPLLPVYDLPLKETSVSGLVEYVRQLAQALALEPAVLIGNSLGGHVAIIYTLTYPSAVEAMVLSGSSGIYEVEMGTATMRRRDRQFIRDRAAVTFFDPRHATNDLVDEVYEIVNDRHRALRLIRMARSAQKETVTERLAAVRVPTLLVWGRNDVITPPDVALQFQARMSAAELHFIPECGHAPMIEHPEAFNRLTRDFLLRRAAPRALPRSNAS